MRLRYTPEARRDLQEIERYISVELCNPSAAKHVISEIMKTCAKLKGQPQMGLRLAQKIGRDTDFMYLISGKHLVFYRIEEKCISVVRVLGNRTNYMQVILGMCQK